LGDLLQKKKTAVTANLTAIEIDFDFFPRTRLKAAG
jgi:hypothetical protein